MANIQVTVKVKGISPLSFSRYHNTDKLNKELPKDYEERTWKEKVHYEKSTGDVFIPGTMFKQSLDETAKFLGIQIPGKGKSNYTKHFEAGVMCVDQIFFTPIVKIDNLQFERLYVPSDGRPGGTTRVEKIFPLIPSGWVGTVHFLIIDSIITKDVFEQHLREAGSLVGIGRFRPRKRGFYGRFTFEPKDLIWEAKDNGE